jgi:hypothetical protein
VLVCTDTLLSLYRLGEEKLNLLLKQYLQELLA